MCPRASVYSLLLTFIVNYGQAIQIFDGGHYGAMEHRSLWTPMVHKALSTPRQWLKVPLITKKPIVNSDVYFAAHTAGIFGTSAAGDSAKSGSFSEKSFSSFGNEHSEATRQPYAGPGHWATPAPDSDIDLDFTPIQTYLQVRRTNSVQRLPRSEAYKEAASEDELLNAHRLKEVLRTKKIQEVYSEEGYDDSRYDHGDEERYAEHGEVFDKQKGGKFRVKDSVQHLLDTDDAGSTIVEKKIVSKLKTRPIVKGQRMEKTSIEVEYMNDGKKNDKFPLFFQTATTTKFNGAPHVHQSRAPVSFMQKSDFPSQNENFWRLPSAFDELKRSRNWNSREFDSDTKFPKFHHERNSADFTKKSQQPAASSVGFIHSLTDSHYGNTLPTLKQKPKPIPSRLINMTDVFKPLDSQSHFAPKMRKRVKRNRGSEEDEEDEEDRERETDAYEQQLSKELDEQERDIIGNTIQNLGGLLPQKDKFQGPSSISSFRDLSHHQPFRGPLFDSKKYPYFYSLAADPYSPLRYASHPREFPRKTGRGMEFYDRKDRETQCDPIEISLDDVPKAESTRGFDEQPGEKKRIVGLGDKIRCLKNKYFGHDPLDSPFFKEDEINKEGIKKARAAQELRYHSSYQYQPNKTLDVFVTDKLNDSQVEPSEERVRYQTIIHHNVTEEQRKKVPKRDMIPVSEEFLPELTTSAPIMGMKPPPLEIHPFTIIRLPPKPKKLQKRQKIKTPHNCLQRVTKMTITERNDVGEKTTYDCADVTLVRIRQGGYDHVQIIPKIRRSEILDESSDAFRLGEVIDNQRFLKRKRRAMPPAFQRKKSALFPNKILLDKIIKRPTLKQNEPKDVNVQLGVKRPLIEQTVKAKSTTPEPAATTFRPTEATTVKVVPTVETPKMEPRPLSRLSGKDFLTKYYKSRSKISQKTTNMDFWKVTPTVSPMRSKAKRDDLAAQSKAISTTPVLLYIVDHVTGRGEWVTEDTTEQTFTTATKKFNEVNEKKMKNKIARRKFFSDRLKKQI